ncbi:hypothetical protein U1Q18_050871 [Sarracenia purpurea var. burkii]
MVFRFRVARRTSAARVHSTRTIDGRLALRLCKFFSLYFFDWRRKISNVDNASSRNVEYPIFSRTQITATAQPSATGSPCPYAARQHHSLHRHAAIDKAIIENDSFTMLEQPARYEYDKCNGIEELVSAPFIDASHLRRVLLNGKILRHF